MIFTIKRTDAHFYKNETLSKKFEQTLENVKNYVHNIYKLLQAMFHVETLGLY